ncbi:HDIG domain-containing metalloprotein [Proteiniclasticum sp. C24MP]|uniref:HDIG domain-containing metalloprotein n=1 Tax=Proteiniclasticum sp. C24MP TaxID=3374101 RepID=UPI0037546FC8
MKRNEALALLKKYNESDSLLKHAYSVEAVMKYFAKINEEDVEYWGNIGLLHDLDYEKYPEMHCVKTREILEKEQADEPFIRAIESHGYGICTEVKPESYMEKVLYTIDELTGLITATVLMRPDRNIHNLEVKSVLKKFKTAKFAAGVNREVVLQGCEMIDMELNEVIGHTIEGMKTVAEDLGFAGQ